MKIICRSLSCVLTFFFTVAVSHASYENGLIGIGFDRTRVVYHEKSGFKGTAVTFENHSDNVFLLQSFIIAPNDLVLSPSALENIDTKKMPFFVAPPLARLEANSHHVLRLVKKKSELPYDRESVFLLVARVIPNTPKSQRVSEQNEMIFTISIILKIFYRPAALPEKGLSSISEQLSFSSEKGKLIVNNPSPFYLTLAGIEVGGKMWGEEAQKERHWMVPPRSQMKYSLPDNMDGSVKIRFLDENGIPMPWIKTNVHCSESCLL